MNKKETSRLIKVLSILVLTIFVALGCQNPLNNDTTSDEDTSSLSSISDLSYTAGNGQISVNWTDPSADDLDHIEVTWTPEHGESQPKQIDPTTESATITGLSNGTEYTFSIVAVDTSGNKSEPETFKDTPMASSPPAEVSNLTSTSGDTEVTLSWTDPTDDSDFDHVEITWDSEDGESQPKVVSADTASATITGLTNGTTYEFTVKTVDIYGNVSPGNTVSAMPKIAVTGVTVSSETGDTEIVEAETLQLTATVEPSDATNQNVSWSSSDATIAEVSSSGLVTGNAEGTVVVTVTTDDGGYTATIGLTVNPYIPATEVSFVGWDGTPLDSTEQMEEYRRGNVMVYLKPVDTTYPDIEVTSGDSTSVKVVDVFGPSARIDSEDALAFVVLVETSGITSGVTLTATNTDSGVEDSFSIDITERTDPPTLIGVQPVDSETISVFYSEMMNISDIGNVDNYTVVDSEGVSIEVLSASPGENGEYADITLGSTFTGGETLRVTVTDVRDLSDASIDPANSEETITFVSSRPQPINVDKIIEEEGKLSGSSDAIAVEESSFTNHRVYVYEENTPLSEYYLLAQQETVDSTGSFGPMESFVFMGNEMIFDNRNYIIFVAAEHSDGYISFSEGVVYTVTTGNE